MEKIPVLDLTYLGRIGFTRQPQGYFSISTKTVEVRVEYETGRGVMIIGENQVPVEFKTVSHLKWFMDAFK